MLLLLSALRVQSWNQGIVRNCRKSRFCAIHHEVVLVWALVCAQRSSHVDQVAILSICYAKSPALPRPQPDCAEGVLASISESSTAALCALRTAQDAHVCIDPDFWTE